MLVKCRHCGLKDTDRTDMVKKSEKAQGYYHPSCLDKENQARAEKEAAIKKEKKAVKNTQLAGMTPEQIKTFNAKETQEKNELVDTIVRIHQLSSRQSIPSTFYSSVLSPFRNDDVLFGKLERRYKSGFSYETLTQTYLFCEEKIRIALGKKEQSGGFRNILGELKYAFAIVRNNIENMLRAQRKQSRLVQQQERMITDAKKMSEVSIQLKQKLKEREDREAAKPKDKNSGFSFAVWEDDEDF